MPQFKIRLTRRDGLTMVYDTTIEADDAATAGQLALAEGRDENNECEWSENDSGEGDPEIETICEMRDGKAIEVAATARGDRRTEVAKRAAELCGRGADAEGAARLALEEAFGLDQGDGIYGASEAARAMGFDGHGENVNLLDEIILRVAADAEDLLAQAK